MNDKKPKRALGRGLSALMADVDQQKSGPAGGAPSQERADRMIPIERIHSNPNQPRRTFTQDQLNELADSIKAKGVIQPIIVRKIKGTGADYEIVAGERRWRASQIAQLHEVPVVIRDYTDTEVIEVAIIENIQRAELNPVEEAAGYRQLMDRFGHTQEKLSEALGKSRSHIANLMRLLNLPEEVQELLKDGSLSAGHARALITSDHPVELARKVVAGGLSVRDTEKLVKRAAQGDPTPKPAAAPSSKTSKDADTIALEGDLSAALRMKVLVDHDLGKESGKIVIKYDTLDQLDDLCRILSSTN